LAQRTEEVERLHGKLLEEKSTMMKPGSGPNDIVGLNFGGELVVKVKRSLLCQFEDSMLAGMFSGRHDDRLDRDEQGNVFLDYSPRVMSPLIDFLRLYRDVAPTGGSVMPPVVPAADHLAWCAMLEFFGLKEVLLPPTIFQGVQHNVDIDSLSGWTLFFSEPYCHATTMDDFVPPDPRLQGGSLLVGARKAGSSVLSVAAMGHFEVLTDHRKDASTTFHNGAYWYCLENKAVGFAPTEHISLSSADTYALSDRSRLSWHLTKSGGYRVGEVAELNNSKEWEKVILATHVKIPLA